MKKTTKQTPTISVIIDKDLRDRAKSLLKKDKRTMTHLIHETLTNYVSSKSRQARQQSVG
jgi:molybdopterin-guanine dinucleotide biosynthesis protein A